MNTNIEGILSDNLHLIRNNNFFAKAVDDELIMMDDKTGNYFSLNSVGKTIWELLDKPTSYEALLDKLMVIYNVSKEQCIEDIKPFLNNLIEKNLLSIYNDSAPESTKIDTD